MVNNDTENKLNKADRSEHEDYKPPKEKRYRKNLSGREEKEDLHLDDILTGNPDDIPGYEEAVPKNKRKSLIFVNPSEDISEDVSTENYSDKEQDDDETQIFDQQSLPEIENSKGLGSLIENKPDNKTIQIPQDPNIKQKPTQTYVSKPSPLSQTPQKIENKKINDNTNENIQKNKKANKSTENILKTIIGLLTLLLIGLGIYLALHKDKSATSENAQAPSSPVVVTSTATTTQTQTTTLLQTVTNTINNVSTQTVTNTQTTTTAPAPSPSTVTTTVTQTAQPTSNPTTQSSQSTAP